MYKVFGMVQTLNDVVLQQKQVWQIPMRLFLKLNNNGSTECKNATF